MVRRTEARGRPLRALPAVLVAATCAAGCQTTTLEFRRPQGSWLELEGAWPNGDRRVGFQSRATFWQVHEPGEAEGAPCRGEIPIDGAVDLAHLPPEAEAYVIRSEDGARVRVRGYYWIYSYEKTTTDELTVHYVDVTPEAIYRLLEGRAVTIAERRGATPVFKFELGIELPEEAAVEPAVPPRTPSPPDEARPRDAAWPRSRAATPR